MKKWFTVDHFIIAFIAAVVWGLGFSIPSALDAPIWVCGLSSCVIGMIGEFMIAKPIMYSRFVQTSLVRKLLVFVAFILVFLLFNLLSEIFLEESLFEQLVEEFGWAIFFIVFGFVVSLIVSANTKRKIKKKYGKGEEGFCFNAKEIEYIKSLNQENKEIVDEYNKSLSVKIKSGIYVGDKEKDVISFCGIPYAKPPVKDLRWKAPQALDASEKVFEAKHYGPSSIQVNYDGNALQFHRQSEDCLYLNVFTSNIHPKVKKPVVVIFHGGDFTFGGSANPLWEPWHFAANHPEFITVSFNFRLGLLGFIDFSDIPGGEKRPDTCNLGLLDQIAVLEWVKENIHAFGGNPDKVTVVGDNAGAISIGLLAASNRAAGLFKKAIVISGTPLSSELGHSLSKESAEQLFDRVNASNMDDLLALSEDEISELTQDLKEYLALPLCDGSLIPKDVYAEYTKGVAKDIQFILGCAEDNVNAYGSSIGREFAEIVYYEIVEEYLEQLEPNIANELRKFLDSEIERVGKAQAQVNFVNLCVEVVATLTFSEALCNGGNDVRVFYWNVPPLIDMLGAGGLNIICTILGNKEAAVAYGSAVAKNVQDVLQALIKSFILGEDKVETFDNQIEMVMAIVWEKFPKFLSITKDKIQLQSLEETVPAAKTVLDALKAS
ncbi:MAG: carboxylesterase family protein [Coriobacteriales bacterium]|nr:carboxylesterase family protein [Coriobacteriales bacterium]